MIGDVLAIAWKEILELFSGGGRGKFAPVLLLFIYGVIFPLQSRRKWVDSYEVVAFAVAISIFLVLSVVADSFAGERERHTLETLLASRLSDHTILIGKIVTVVLYGWGLTIVSLLIGLVSVNLSVGGGHILLYPGRRAAVTVVLSLLAAILASGIGVLVSLRSSTVRQATQVLTIGPVAVFFVIAFVIKSLSPSARAEIVKKIYTHSLTLEAIALIAFLLVLDVLVLYIDSLRFQRDRLILD